MKRFFLLLCFTFSLYSCKQESSTDIINIGASAQYPPFVYMENNQIVGFEIDLLKLIFERLNKKINISDIQFGSIMPSLQSKQIEIGIGAITITDERKKNFDFSIPYYFDGIGVIFLKESNFSNINILKIDNKKVGSQLGTTQEIWVKRHIINNQLKTMDSNSQLVEAIKSKYIDIAVIDESQAKIFSEMNADLDYKIVEKAEDGYGMIFEKNYPLKDEINKQLKILEDNGKLESLKIKWRIN